MKDFQLPVSDIVKKDIYKSIQHGLLDMEEFTDREKLTFQNGFAQLKWAYIFTRLYHDLNIENGKVLKGKRGPWPLTMIYDESTSYLYVVMKKKNFNLLQRSVGRKEIPHYVEALSTFNIGFEHEINSSQIEPFQTQLDIEFNSQAIESTLNSLLGDLKSKVKGFAIIAFEGKNNINEMRAFIPNSNLDIIYQEDWSKVIEVDYTMDEGSGDAHESEQDDILLSFNDEVEDKDNKDTNGE